MLSFFRYIEHGSLVTNFSKRSQVTQMQHLGDPSASTQVTRVLKDWLRIPVPPNKIYYIQQKLEIERVGKHYFKLSKLKFS